MESYLKVAEREWGFERRGKDASKSFEAEVVYEKGESMPGAKGSNENHR